MKKVSVIIPCFNHSEYLLDAVKSVVNSTYKNLEIIVVNDGSTEKTPQEIQSMLMPFDNVILINQENSGVCAARNNGIIKASGEYILPLDADDRIADTYIEKAVSILEQNPDIGIAYCEAEFFGTGQNKKWNLKPATLSNMLIQNRIFPSGVYRKSKFLEVGSYKKEMELGCEDWDFWLSIIETGTKVYQIPEVLFYYRKKQNERTKQSLRPINYLKIRINIVKFHNKLYKQFGQKMYFLLGFMVCKNCAAHLYKLLRRKLK